MTRKDYDHLTHELDNILNGFIRHRNRFSCVVFIRHRNRRDCAVAEEVVGTFKSILDGYWAYCDDINNHRIPGKTHKDYQHNYNVHGGPISVTELREELIQGDKNCKHELYREVFGSVKCIKCGAWERIIIRHRKDEQDEQDN